MQGPTNLDQVKRGDIIVADKVRRLVLARLEDLIFSRMLHDDGRQGPPEGPNEISDLSTWGFKIEQGPVKGD